MTITLRMQKWTNLKTGATGVQRDRPTFWRYSKLYTWEEVDVVFDLTPK